MYCKDCEHWGLRRPNGMRECKRSRDDYDGMAYVADDTPSDDIDFVVGIFLPISTGPLFGCVDFKGKEATDE